MTVTLNSDQDAFGQLILARFANTRRTREIIERDDGFIEANEGPDTYFAPVRRWSPAERRSFAVRARTCAGRRLWSRPRRA